MIPIQLQFCLQMMASCLLLCSGLPRRRRGRIFAGVSCAVMFFLSLMLSRFPMAERMAADVLYWLAFAAVFSLILYAWGDISFFSAVYGMLCALNVQHIAHDVYRIIEIPAGDHLLMQCAVFLTVYAILWKSLIHRLGSVIAMEKTREDYAPVLMIVLLVQLISVIMRKFGREMSGSSVVLYLICEIFCCVYIFVGIVLQFEKNELSKEVAVVRSLMHQQKIQYEITQENIDTINRKCHDLRHQVRTVFAKEKKQDSQYVRELETALNMYDTSVRTGNEALDTVLMEKMLYCQAKGIQCTCLVDGSRIGFMEEADLYAMFGNALDNAIFASLGVKDPSKRIISVRCFQQGDFLMIQIRNYYDGAIQMKDGLPETTQKDQSVHGYGMKSIRYTAEKYGGVLTVQAKDGVFSLQVLIPIADNADAGRA